MAHREIWLLFVIHETRLLKIQTLLTKMWRLLKEDAVLLKA
jgi:hypothetical protein